jgi:hypothetical protein
MAVITVVPLHRMIRDALQQLREARDDGDPQHNPLLCSGACLICTSSRHLDRLLDRIPRKADYVRSPER